MAPNDLLTTLEALNTKIELLTEQHRQLQEDFSKLKVENESLKADLDYERKNMQKALNDIEFLSVSHRLAESADSVVSARRIIERLIRTIDNCITMINEE